MGEAYSPVQLMTWKLCQHYEKKMEKDRAHLKKREREYYKSCFVLDTWEQKETWQIKYHIAQIYGGKNSGLERDTTPSKRKPRQAVMEKLH